MLYHHLNLQNPSGIVGTGELATLLALAGSGNLTVSSNTSWANTADAFYRARFNTLTINSGCILNLQNRGVMSILCDGNFVLNGTISADARGISAAGQAVTYTLNGGSTVTIAQATGAAGGAKQNQNPGNSGQAGGAGQCGGGGAGGVHNSGGYYGGSGAAATGLCGGAGGGGTDNGGAPGGDAIGNGGAGGAGGGMRSGGGAGNPGGASGASPATAGGTGSGGVIFIFVLGNVTLQSGSVLTAQGEAGGSDPGGVGGGGGGSGGGLIQVRYSGSYTNLGCTFNVAGGPGGSGYNAGGAGGAGYYAVSTM